MTNLLKSWVKQGYDTNKIYYIELNIEKNSLKPVYSYGYLLIGDQITKFQIKGGLLSKPSWKTVMRY